MISKNAASGQSVKKLLAGETNPGHKISKPPHKDWCTFTVAFVSYGGKSNQDGSNMII